MRKKFLIRFISFHFPALLTILLLFIPSNVYGLEWFSAGLLRKTPETQRQSLRNPDGVRFLGQSSESLPPLRLESHAEPMDGFGLSPGAIGSDGYRQPYDARNHGMEYEPRMAPGWTWQFLPDGILYPNYLAGVNESRMAGVWNYDKDVDWIWDITLGGRTPLLRYGSRSALYPEGWQLDFEGSAHLRLDMEHERDMDATDYRFGFPICYGNRVWQFKTGYYHVSSHLGDERMLRLEKEGIYHDRINYVREAILLGLSYRIRPSLRVYAEADYAFWAGQCTRPWHFQFGAEYSSPYPTNGFWGKPFAALNILLLQEHDFDGSICIQAGWQWRGKRNEVFRIGLQYFGGVSEQYEHIAKREHKVGLGIWFDF